MFYIIGIVVAIGAAGIAYYNRPEKNGPANGGK